MSGQITSEDVVERVGGLFKTTCIEAEVYGLGVMMDYRVQRSEDGI